MGHGGAQGRAVPVPRTCCSARYDKDRAMVKTVRKFASFHDLKDEEYRYWHSRTPAERIAATFEHSVDAYRRKGIAADGQGLKRTLVRFERSRS